ncbi:MAG: molybdopterin-guanine dinucleotide biosynthesis protein B [Candidatus Methanomethylicaceae archaeon]
MSASSPVVCIAALGRGYGKTTIIQGVTRLLTSKGMRVCVIKHSSHRINNEPEKDTSRFIESGASASAALTNEGKAVLYLPNSTLEATISLMSKMGTDIILCEGFKSSSYPKLVIARSPEEFPIIEKLHGVIGIIFDGTVPDTKLPVLKRDPSTIADFIILHLRSVTKE